eukprot:403346040
MMFIGKFDLDLFSDDISQSKTKALTDEEINKMQTNESFTSLQKAMYIMKKGYEVQKKSVIEHLDQYLVEPQSNKELVPLISNSIEYWDDDFQMECGMSVKRACEKKLLSGENVDIFMQICLDFLDHIDNDVQYEAWIKTFPTLCQSMSQKCLKTVCLPKLQEMLDSKPQPKRRKRGAEMIGILVANSTEDTIVKELRKYIFACTQDHNWNFRKSMTSQMKEVFSKKISKETFQNYFYEELIELINDEDLLVRIEALEVAVEIIICRSQNLEVRTNAAINLPCFFYYFSNIDDPELDFLEIYSEFSQDENQDIKEIIAKGIHEVLELLEKQGKNPFTFEEPFQNLLKQNHNTFEVQMALAQNIGGSFGTFLRAFSMEILNVGCTFETFIDSTLKNENAGDLVELYQLIQDMIEDIVKLNEFLIERNKNWREHSKFYIELSKIVDLIPLTIIQEFYDAMLPSLLDLMQRGPDQLKQAASMLATTLIFYVPNTEKRQRSITQVTQEFSNTGSSILRKSFIDFCVCALKVCSVQFVRTYLMRDILSLATDVTPSVRIKFLNVLVPELNTVIGPLDQSFVIELMAIVDRCKSDRDRMISDAAYELDDRIQFNKNITKEKLKQAQDRENMLIKVDVMIKQREQFEFDEDERRKKEEEEEKFDIAALLAKVKLTKNKGGFGFNTKHHFTTMGKIDTAKRSIQHRHSFTATGSTNKKPIINVAAERRPTITTANSNKNGKRDNYFSTDTAKKPGAMNGCSTPQSSSNSIISFSSQMIGASVSGPSNKSDEQRTRKV